MAQSPDLTLEALNPGFHRPSPQACYVAASLALLGLWAGYYLFDPFGYDSPIRDSWHHVAVLRELIASPFAPSNPHIPTDEPSRYFTPVMVLAALFGKLFDLSPYRLFGYMGAATCIGLVAGCWVFARRYYGSAWAPLCLLLVLLFAWGSQMSHVGLHNYATLLGSAAYPSSIALVLGLFSWNLVIKTLESDGQRALQLPLLAALSAVILLTHQLSGVIMLAGAGSLALFHTRGTTQSKALVLIALALGCPSTLAWPYFSIIDVLTSASDERWRSPVEGINSPLILLILSAPSVIGIIGFRSSDRGFRWELLLPSVFFTASYVVLSLQGSPIAHRLVPAIILFNQLGLVWLIVAYFGRPQPDAAKRLAFAGVAVALIILAVSAGTRRFEDLRTRAAEGSLQVMAAAIASDLPEGSISFATEGVVFPLQSTGRRVVSIPRPEPVAPSLIERQSATDRFFHHDTSVVERRQLIELWSATHIVFAAHDLDANVIRELRELGTSKRFSRDVEVITIDRLGVRDGERQL